MAGGADGGDVGAVCAGLVQAFANGSAGVAPEFGDVAFDMAGVRLARLTLERSARQHVAVEVEQHRLDHRVAGVDAEQIPAHAAAS